LAPSSGPALLGKLALFVEANARNGSGAIVGATVPS